MMRRLVVALVAASLVACASETDDESAGRFGDGSEEAPTRSDEVNEGQDQQTSDQPLTSDGSPSETPTDTSTPPSSTKPTTTCNKPHDLGSIAGDVDGSTVTAQGGCTEWLRIRALETKTGPLANGMKLTATLISPPGVNFDLFAYVDTDADSLECSTSTAKSEAPASRSDVVSLEWGEGWTANGSDDSRTVSIQVVAKDPSSCGKGTWALLLEGNK